MHSDLQQFQGKIVRFLSHVGGPHRPFFCTDDSDGRGTMAAIAREIEAAS